MNEELYDLITVRDLGVRVRGTGRVLLRDVNFEVPRHRITGIIGPSGAGKSTLLKCINRLIELVPGLEVSGSVSFDGRDIRESDPDELGRPIATLFKNPGTFHAS